MNDLFNTYIVDWRKIAPNKFEAKSFSQLRSCSFFFLFLRGGKTEIFCSILALVRDIIHFFFQKKKKTRNRIIKK